MGTEHGFRRLENFSDAVVAIAITLLILPLVDSASSIGPGGLGPFVHHHDAQFLAFGLSFAVIGSFWWGQHQALERVITYDRLLIVGMFVWILSIVFLPFPTELLSAATNGGQGVHGLYVGTMLVTSIGVLIQQWAVVRRPELTAEEHRGEATLAPAVILTALMAVVFVIVIALPAVGLWALLLLVASRPLSASPAPGGTGEGAAASRGSGAGGGDGVADGQHPAGLVDVQVLDHPPVDGHDPRPSASASAILTNQALIASNYAAGYYGYMLEMSAEKCEFSRVAPSES